MARRPRRHHDIDRGTIRPWPDDAESPKDLAKRVTYGGSPLHKDHPSPAGPPAWRSDKAKCPKFPEKDWAKLLKALRQAIEAKCVDSFQGAFPKRAWAWINGILHEARLTNKETGEYHGFPIDDERQYPEPPDALEKAPRVDIPVDRT